MWACYFGEISDSYRERWEAHTVSPEQKAPDIFDVIKSGREILYRLDMTVAAECFPGWIQVDWGGWAYKVDREKILKYNEESCYGYRIPEEVLTFMEPGKEYVIIDVEMW